MTKESEPVQLTCSSAQRGRWENAAKNDSLAFEDWIRLQLDDAADEEMNQTKWTSRDTRTVLGIVAIIIALVILTPFLVSWILNGKIDFSCLTLGEFGDMFGATNTLFSGFAFLGVVYAIILQKKELKAQRIELRRTRIEFEQQNQTSHEQHKTMEMQRFENTFFHLLDGLKQDMENLTSPGSQKNGSQCFTIVKNKLTLNATFPEFTSPIEACDSFKVITTDTVDLNYFFSMVENILKFLMEKKKIAGRVHFDAVDTVFNKESRWLLFYKTRLSPGWNEIDPDLVNKITKDRLSVTDFQNQTHFDWPIWNSETQA